MNEFKNLAYLATMLKPIVDAAVKEGIEQNAYWSPQYLQKEQEQNYIDKALIKYGEKLLKMINEKNKNDKTNSE